MVQNFANCNYKLHQNKKPYHWGTGDELQHLKQNHSSKLNAIYERSNLFIVYDSQISCMSCRRHLIFQFYLMLHILFLFYLNKFRKPKINKTACNF
jgi:hypothetical protein